MRESDGRRKAMARLTVQWLLVAAAAAGMLFAGTLARATTLTWDANTGTGGAQDGSGTWNTTNPNWWTGSANTSWSNSPPDSAIFGVGGPGNGTVTVGEDIDANDLTFNSGATYTLAGANRLTLHGTHEAALYSYVTVNQDATINCEVACSAPVRKYGAGTLVLGGANAFGTSRLAVLAGVVNLRHDDALGNMGYVLAYPGGTLQVQDGITVTNGIYLYDNNGGVDGKGSLRSISGHNTWSGYVRLHSTRSAGTIGVDADTLTISSGIATYGTGGAFSLTKVGAGTLILSGAGTYHGPTYVNEGVVNIRNNTALGTTAAGTTVAAGAALQVQNNITVAEALDVTGRGISNTGALRSVSGNNTWNGDITLRYDGTLKPYVGVDTGSTLTINGHIDVPTGSWAKTGGGKLILTAANTQHGYTDVGGGGILNLQHGSALGGISDYAHVASGSTLEVEGGITVPNSLYIGNTSSGSSTVCLRSVSGDNTWAGTVYLHNSHQHARIGVDPASTLTISGIIRPRPNYTFDGSLTKVGDGTLVLTHANTYTGNTYINEGTLQLAGGDNRINPSNRMEIEPAGTLELSGVDQGVGFMRCKGTVQLTGGAVLTLGNNNQYSDFWGSSSISGDGGVRKVGTHTAHFAAQMTYSGGTSIEGGILGCYNGNNRLPTTGDVSIGGSGTFSLASSGGNITEQTIDELSGSGRVRITRSGGASVNFIVGNGNGTSTFSGLIEDGTGTISLTKKGTGTQTLDGANTYSGATTVTQGTLRILDGGALGSAAAGTKVEHGATLQMDGNVTVASEPLELVGTGTLQSASGSNAWNGDVTLDYLPQPLHHKPTFRVDSGSTLTVNGQITGTGPWIKSGGGKLILTAANSQSSFVDLSGGILNLQNDNALGNASFTHAVSGSTLEVEGGISVPNPNGLYIGNSSSSGTSVDFRNVSGDNEWAGYVRLHSGHPYARIDVNSGSTLTISGIVQPHNNSIGSLTKLGDGTLILSHANTYTGPTYVNEGTLLVNNTSGSGTGSGAVTVNGGTLGGTGTISGAVTVNAGAHVAPGFSPGILTTGVLTLESGAELDIELLGTLVGDEYDQLDVTGSVSLDDSILNATLGYDAAFGDSFTIINNDGADAVVGTFRDLPEKGSFYLPHGGNDHLFHITYRGGQDFNDVVLTSVPEPATLTLLALGALGLVARRRRK